MLGNWSHFKNFPLITVIKYFLISVVSGEKTYMKHREIHSKETLKTNSIIMFLSKKKICSVLETVLSILMK
jgi:hypothetical protein